ncbi:hypothetical protein TYRP_023166 [Tyrophagus putrescentiae]|nr:hypothetical protein TYRP_023166 [Tyrophagus putrescentiae]
MSSAGRKSSKPPSASESFASFKAAKKTYCSIDYQIECLNELYNQLIPQNRRASSSSDQRDPKVLQQLRLLKANLLNNYGNPLLLPPLERLKVVVMFDDRKKAFFDIRLRPRLGYPTGYPFFMDDNEKGTIVGLSEAIYQEVLNFVQEEEEEEEEGERGGDEEGNQNNSLNNNHNHDNNSHTAEEEELIRGDMEEEEVDDDDDDEEEVEVITLDDDSDEERFDDELHQKESYNSQVNPPPSTNNSARGGDFRGSAKSAPSASSSSAAIVPPENAAEQQQHQRQQSVSGGGSTSLNRRQSERQSDTVTIKLEPSNSSTVTITRVGRSPNRVSRKGHDEARAAAASVAVPPPPPAATEATPADTNVRVFQVNLRPPNVSPSKSKPQQQLPPSHSNNNGTTPFGRQRQQQPLATAAAAVAEERGTLKRMKPTEANSSSTYRILDSNNNNKRPADYSNAAQPQGSPKRAKVSASAAAAGTSTRAAANANESACPLCEESYPKTMMEDHLDMAHINRNQYVPYRCTYPGCTYTNVWGTGARAHAWQHHNGEQYIVKVAAAVVPTRTAGSLSLASSSSSSATNRATTTTTASTTSTFKPSAASTSQQQQRPSTSTSTAQTFSAEDYLRANCPAYAATKTARTRVKCPQCSKSLPKHVLKDHIFAEHRGLKPYHCQWPGCSFSSSWRSSATQHVKEQHNGSYAQYILYREDSAGRKNSKLPSASESFASFKAAKKTYCSIDYQIECLNELYNQLMPQTNGNRRAGSSSRDQDGSRNSKVFQQLRELKANLRKDYGNPRDIPPLESLKVLVMFDDHKKPFFDIRLRPFSGYPTGYPFFIDDNDKGTIVGISEAIYQEVLKAVQEEEEGRGGNGEGNNNSLNHNNSISHAAEEGLIRVNIKQEVEDDVKVEVDSQVNSPTDSNTNSRSSNKTAVQHQRQQFVSGGSTVSQGQSHTVPIKLERSSTVAITRVDRSLKMKPTENSNNYRLLDNINKRSAANSNAAQPQENPKRAKVSASTPGTSSTQAAASATSQAISEHFIAPTDDSPCPLCEKSYPKAAIKDHLDMAHINRAQYVPYRCTYPGCKYTNVWGINARAHARQHHNGEQYIVKVAAAVVPTRTAGSLSLASSSSSSATNRATTTTTASTISTFKPSAASTSQQQQQRPSTSTSTAQTFSAEDYLRANCPAYAATKTARTRVKCPQCSKSLPKHVLKDHIFAEHRGLKPYHCQWPGCSFSSSWRSSATQHVKEQHNGSYAQYILYREDTLQHQQQRPSSSASTTTSTAKRSPPRSTYRPTAPPTLLPKTLTPG